MTEAMPFLQKAILLSYDPRPLAGALLAVEKVACATFLRLRRGQGAMQGNPCYARLFADLTRMSPNPIIASGGQSRAPPVAGGARRKPSEQGSARKAPRADAARPLRTALRPPDPQRFFDSQSRGEGPCFVGAGRPRRPPGAQDSAQPKLGLENVQDELHKDQQDHDGHDRPDKPGAVFDG